MRYVGHTAMQSPPRYRVHRHYCHARLGFKSSSHCHVRIVPPKGEGANITRLVWTCSHCSHTYLHTYLLVHVWHGVCVVVIYLCVVVNIRMCMCVPMYSIRMPKGAKTCVFFHIGLCALFRWYEAVATGVACCHRLAVPRTLNISSASQDNVRLVHVWVWTSLYFSGQNMLMSIVCTYQIKLYNISTKYPLRNISFLYLIIETGLHVL